MFNKNLPQSTTPATSSSPSTPALSQNLFSKAAKPAAPQLMDPMPVSCSFGDTHFRGYSFSKAGQSLSFSHEDLAEALVLRAMLNGYGHKDRLCSAFLIKTTDGRTLALSLNSQLSNRNGLGPVFDLTDMNSGSRSAFSIPASADLNLTVGQSLRFSPALTNTTIASIWAIENRASRSFYDVAKPHKNFGFEWNSDDTHLHQASAGTSSSQAASRPAAPAPRQNLFSRSARQTAAAAQPSSTGTSASHAASRPGAPAPQQNLFSKSARQTAAAAQPSSAVRAPSQAAPQPAAPAPRQNLFSKSAQHADSLSPSKGTNITTPGMAISCFTTAKGSVYQIQEDGTTIRSKAARDDVGHEGDFGLKPQSAKTIYVESEVSASLLSSSGLTSLDGRKFYVVLGNGAATLMLGRTAVDPRSGKNIPFSETPTVGWCPVELWKPRPLEGSGGVVGYFGQHAGNKIVHITRKGDADGSSSSSATAGPTPTIVLAPHGTATLKIPLGPKKWSIQPTANRRRSYGMPTLHSPPPPINTTPPANGPQKATPVTRRGPRL